MKYGMPIPPLLLRPSCHLRMPAEACNGKLYGLGWGKGRLSRLPTGKYGPNAEPSSILELSHIDPHPFPPSIQARSFFSRNGIPFHPLVTPCMQPRANSTLSCDINSARASLSPLMCGHMLKRCVLLDYRIGVFPYCSICAIMKVLLPLNPIPKLAGYSPLHHRDPCLFSIAIEPGSKSQATSSEPGSSVYQVSPEWHLPSI